MNTDVLIVGAGFAGLVMAERLSNVMGLRCLVLDKRAHVGGNAHDAYNEAGVLTHVYGPHYFRSNSSKVVDYLSQFTAWLPTSYEIRSFAEGRYWHFPINLNTFEELIGRPSDEEEFKAYLEHKRVPISKPQNSEEVIVSQVGWELYEKFFKGYTLKQWKKHPRELDASVCGRIPIRTNRDNRYLQETFQALPAAGYHRLFQNMIEASPGVQIMLRTDYRELLPHVKFRHMVYTGPVDEFFDCRFGALPYRSLRFETQSFEADTLASRAAIAGKQGFWQPAMQVNYPNEHDFTRIVEIKHATRQRCENTSIVYEYPDDYGPGKEPYYPVPTAENSRLYAQYAELAAATAGVSFIGRLATYRYYNMDQVVGMALHEFEKIEPALSATQPRALYHATR
ncbi:UDP-galactopyranose mutase [Prosthecobacter sp.]|uniref:UDP-galactopyranose/dTDP-fucopyranose mutase family protein n=1 Tax=Prosthecobacter sp. TaxID=1965333 RepID=UPI00248714CF|nr:UDP-galactopyranose mutase [Prosthecobacter sp.]MDI1315125.1 UDP-galactopyranose mutase [Prosthecobacter sp.]